MDVYFDSMIDENYWEVDNQDVIENNKQSDFPGR